MLASMEFGAKEVLQTMITPAFLISATGTLIMSTSNRVARVTDRVRELARAAHESSATREFATRQLEFLAERLLLLRSALQALYGAMALYVGASLVIGCSSVFPWMGGWEAVALGLLGATVMLGGSFQLVRESRLATRSTLGEVEHLRRELSSSAGNAGLQPGSGLRGGGVRQEER